MKVCLLIVVLLLTGCSQYFQKPNLTYLEWAHDYADCEQHVWDLYMAKYGEPSQDELGRVPAIRFMSIPQLEHLGECLRARGYSKK